MGTYADTLRSKFACYVSSKIENSVLHEFSEYYLEKLIEITVPSQLELLEETGCIDNFCITSRKKLGSCLGHFLFSDFDVCKWIEVVSYVSNMVKGSRLLKSLNKTIRYTSDMQSEDGYLISFSQINKDQGRYKDLARGHEFYTVGHLTQIAIAHREIAGDKSLFELARSFSDLVCETLSLNRKEGASGHDEIEMTLVKLCRETGEKKCLDQAKYSLNICGRGLAANVPRNLGPVYFIYHKLFTRLYESVEHPVRMLYLCCRVTDVYLESGDGTIWNTLAHLCEDLTTREICIAGGVGSKHDWEPIGESCDLPNRRAYAETCASVANFIWNHRVLLTIGKSKFVDVMGQILYSDLLAGISLDGAKYFYFYDTLPEDVGNERKQKWFDYARCPLNIARTIVSFSFYIYAQPARRPRVNFYEDNYFFVLQDKVPIEVVPTNNDLWSKGVNIIVSTNEAISFTLMLRIPS